MVQKNTIKEKCYFIRIGVHMTSGKVLYKGKEYNSLGGATKAIGSGASGQWPVASGQWFCFLANTRAQKQVDYTQGFEREEQGF